MLGPIVGSSPRRAAGEFPRGEGGRWKVKGQMSRDKNKVMDMS